MKILLIDVNCKNSSTGKIVYDLYTNIKENKGIHIHIEKHTPFCAGMGGGSADGAAVLVALNKIFNTNYSEKILCRIGVRVGADIPFCIVGGTALALDTGAVVAPLPDFENYHIVLFIHNANILLFPENLIIYSSIAAFFVLIL